ncbi:sulfur carrier protein ThiS [Crenobacter cavernae]|uniref:Sulfur carrier protein ThiS n=1 Tax=Crenobacter cavernae TaxID=2290923 RepID=A0ABY0F922_9NEIS|nr:sulfur carrier protein ThiS [Crenobacter cavernae]RXZ41991.1 sulfur carrier protein ThiS [Crenobacter cavernae]
MHTVLVNGEQTELTARTSVHHLLEKMGLLERRVAVERNGDIVPRSRHDETWLCHGDRIEIIIAVGGG